MDVKENRRMFSRHIVDRQSSLQVGLCCSRDKPKDKQYSKNLIDISSGGFSFITGPEDDILFPGTFLDKIEIISSEGCLLQTSGEVRHVYCSSENLSKPSYKVGVKFELEFTDSERLHKANLKKLHEKIIDPAFIFNNLKSLVENRIPVSLENIEHPTHPIAIGHFTQLLNSHKFYTLTFEPADHKLSKLFFEDFDRVQVIYQLNADGYRFASVVISQTQNEVAIKLPKSLMHLWQRNTLRYVSPDDDPLKVKIIHPLLNGESLQCKVIDLTPEGFSIAMVYPNDLFVEGMIFSHVTLIIPSKRRINTAVQVKYIGMAMDEKAGSYLKCGFHFVDLPQKEVNFIVSYLLDKKYPYLKDARGERAETIWNLFYESGFIYEEKNAFLNPIEAEVNDTFKKLLEPDTRFYKEIILKDDIKCYGTVAGVLAYEQSWIIQHLAAIKHPRKFISKDIILAIADFCSKHPDVGYQIMYWRPNNSWAEKSFGRYARKVADMKELSHLVRYDYLLKTPLQNGRKINLPDGITIKPLTKKDRPLIESFFVARGEFVLLQANSLLRKTIDLPSISQMYREKGLKRSRCIYIAKSGQKFLGFVIVEDSSLGLNLSGLLNCFRTYTTPECGEMETEVKCGLIQKAIKHYRKLGRDFAICLANDENIEIYKSLGFKKKKEYMCWTFSQKLAQPYFNYVNDFFTRLEKRKARKASIS